MSANLSKTAPSADDPQSFSHHYAQTNGIRTYYVEEGHGPLVILVHGIPYIWYWWRRQIRSLAAAGYRVIAPDVRGFGQSDCPAGVRNYTVFHAAADIVDLMSALGERTAVIIGHDMGSRIARAAVELRPDLFRALVMINSPVGQWEAGKPSDGWKKIQTATGKRFYHHYLQDAGEEMNADVRKTLRSAFYSVSGSATGNDRWRILVADGETILDTFSDPTELPPWLSPAALDYYVSEYSRTGFAGMLNFYRNIDFNWEHSAFLRGQKLQQPSMFIGGAADPSNELSAPTYEQLENALPNLRKKVMIEGVGHSAAEEQPVVVTELLLKFLTELRTPQ